jgi:hypothetical protein
MLMQRSNIYISYSLWLDPIALWSLFATKSISRHPLLCTQTWMFGFCSFFEITVYLDSYWQTQNMDAWVLVIICNHSISQRPLADTNMDAWVLVIVLNQGISRQLLVDKNMDAWDLVIICKHGVSRQPLTDTDIHVWVFIIILYRGISLQQLAGTNMDAWVLIFFSTVA